MFPNVFILDEGSTEINSTIAGQLVCNVALYWLHHKYGQVTYC